MEATININMKMVVACLLAVGAITAGYEAWQHHTDKTQAQTTAQAQPDPFAVDPFANANSGKATTPSPDAGASSVAVATTTPASEPVAVANTATTDSTAQPKLSGKSFAKANNVSFNLAQSLYDKQDYFSSIIAYGEGWRNGCYNDNKGISCFFGMNVSYHKKDEIRNMATQTSADLTQINALVAQTGEFSMLPSTRLVNFTPDQGQVVMRLSEKQYLASANKPFLKAGLDISKLKKNEMDAMGYMAYRCGSLYSSLSNALIQYAKTGSDSDKQKVIDNIHITYMMNGKKLTDTRTAGAIQALFESPETYATLLNKNPSYVSTLASAVPAYKGVNFTSNQSVDDQIPDVVGQIKEQYYERGKSLPFSQDDLVEAAKENSKPVIVRRGGFAAPSTWY